MKIRNKQGNDSNNIFLIFLKGELKYVAKSYREDFEYGKKLLRNECNILSFLGQNISNNSILAAIPKVVSLNIFSNYLVLLTTAFTGYHIIPDITNCNKRCINAIETSFSWLEQCYLSQKSKIIELDSNSIELLIKNPIKKFYLNFKIESKQFHNYFQRYIDKWLGLKGLKFPLVLSHGDFNPHNILFDDQKLIGVIDWEDAVYNSFPFNDILHYCVVSGRGKGPGRDNIVHYFKDYFLKDGWYKEITDEKSVRLLKHLKVENCNEVIRLYIPIYLASMANKERENNRITFNRMHEWIEMLSIYFDIYG